MNGWRAIADYLGRNQSTVKRWAADGGLPVHRPKGSAARKGVPVYAFADELDAWLRGREGLDDQAAPDADIGDSEAVSGAPVPAPTRPVMNRRYLTGFAVALVMGGGGAIWWHTGRSASPSQRSENADEVPAEARQLYLRGTYLWNRRTPESIAEAIPTFKRALDIYPDYADAYAGLAMTYNLARQYSGMSGFEAYPLAEAAARRAVQLDPDNAFAQAVLAFVEFHWLWQVKSGLARFEHALKLDPDAANVLMWYASSLWHAGRASEAVTFIERAQQLDPNNTTILIIKAQMLFFSGDRQGGHALLSDLIRNDPEHAWNYESLSRFRLMEGDYVSALENYAKAGDLIKVPRYRQVAEAGLTALRTGGKAAMGVAMAAVDTELFAKDEALAWDVARAHAMVGDAENAVTWLRVSFERHEERLIGILSDPAMRPIRHDQDYQKIVSDVGLPMML